MQASGPAEREDSAPDAPALLRLDNVSAAPAEAAAPVLADVSFALQVGECIGLVGASGSGKTTLLRTIGRMLRPRAGTMRFEGEDLALLEGEPLRRARTRIGMITQKQDLVESLRVDKNVMAGALGRWSNWHALRFLFVAREAELAEAQTALAAVGLADKLKRRTSALSGGEQQRVAIARALVQAPALLLADEPVSSLDPDTAGDVLALLTRLTRSRGMALITSLHQPDLAARFCDRVFEVRGGTVVERPGMTPPAPSAGTTLP